MERVCEAEKASAVETIRLRLGALAGVNREAFEFAFPLAAEGTRAAHAKLAFEAVLAEIACDDCGRRATPGKMFLTCGACGSNRVRVTAGREFEIVSVEVREKAVGRTERAEKSAAAGSAIPHSA